MTDLARLPTLLTATLLLLGGLARSSDTGLSAALFTAGFILMGAWLALEIRYHRESAQMVEKQENNDESP